jgi:hypothetical protein
VGGSMFAGICPFVCRFGDLNHFATASARSASSMMVYRSNIARVFQPQSFMISPSDRPRRRKSWAAVRRSSWTRARARLGQAAASSRNRPTSFTIAHVSRSQ